MAQCTPAPPNTEGREPVPDLPALAARIAGLEATVEALVKQLAEEVRTQRLVVVDDHGFGRITADAAGHRAAFVQLTGRRYPGADEPVTVTLQVDELGDVPEAGLFLTGTEGSRAGGLYVRGSRRYDPHAVIGRELDEIGGHSTHLELIGPSQLSDGGDGPEPRLHAQVLDATAEVVLYSGSTREADETAATVGLWTCHDNDEVNGPPTALIRVDDHAEERSL